jgi:phosphopantetheinyl transferase
MYSGIQLVFMNTGSCPHVELEQSLLSRLHITEQARYSSFLNKRRRQIWLAGRALLVALLQRHLGSIDITAIRTDEKGGVRFHGNALHLSLSHSHDMLVASMAGTRTGVDLEWLRPRTVLRHVTRVFNCAEANQLRVLTKPEQLDRFYIFWTLKEAACKAAEISLWESLKSTNFDLQNGIFKSHPPFPTGDWHFMSACVKPGWRVSVAIRDIKDMPQIESWRFTTLDNWRRLELTKQTFLHRA